MDRDRLDEASLLLGHALEVAEEHGLTDAALRAYNNLAEALEAQDRFAEGMALAERALAAAGRAGARVWELRFLTNSIKTLVQLGRWDDALAWAKEARAAEELAEQEVSATALMELAPILAYRGELGEARAMLDSQGQLESSASWERRVDYGTLKAQVLLLEGRPADALAVLDPVLAIREELGLGLSNANVKRALVTAMEAALSLPDLSRAEELIQAVESARPGQVTPWLRAQLVRLRARADDLRGAQGSVEPGFRAAEEGFRDLGAIPDLGVVLTEHAEWLGARAELERAEAPRDEARHIWEQLQARWWLGRLDRVPAGRSQSA
jgi:tetratricopeptide (TPR) repeat protein